MKLFSLPGEIRQCCYIFYFSSSKLEYAEPEPAKKPSDLIPTRRNSQKIGCGNVESPTCYLSPSLHTALPPSRIISGHKNFACPRFLPLFPPASPPSPPLMPKKGASRYQHYLGMGMAEGGKEDGESRERVGNCCSGVFLEGKEEDQGVTRKLGHASRKKCG